MFKGLSMRQSERMHMHTLERVTVAVNFLVWIMHAKVDALQNKLKFLSR